MPIVGYNPQLKVVVAPADDTDPPLNPINTTDNMIGINPPMVLIKDLPTPQDYEAVGDGATDDTVAYQAWLDAIAGGSGYAAPGTYLISSELYIDSGTTIYGSGRATHIVLKDPSFPTGSGMLRNRNLPVSLNTFSDSDICIQGVCFDGASLTSSNAMWNFLGVAGLTVRDCCLRNQHYFIAAHSGCINVCYDNNRFQNWGRREADHADPMGSGLREGGPALWFHSGVTGDTREITITNNYFTDAQWGAIFIQVAYRTTIAGNKFYNIKEYGVALGGYYNVVSNNHFRTIRLMDVSMHGMEASGEQAIISHNTFDDIGGECIHCISPIQFTLTNNICRTPQRESGGSGAAIYIRSAGDLNSGTASQVTIANNLCSDPTGTTQFGILFGITGGGTAISDINCQGNILSGFGGWTVAPIGFYPDMATVLGERCMIRNNLGVNDIDLQTTIVNFQILTGATGLISVAGVGFRPRHIDFRAVLPNASNTANFSIGTCGWRASFDTATQTISSARTAFVNDCIEVAADGTEGWSGQQAGVKCISIVNADGSAIGGASLVSMDDDGFTLEIHSDADPVTADITVFATCHA